jgi:hypothetical protein
VILVARRRERLEELAAELRQAHADLRVHVEACDLGDLPAVATMVRRLQEEVGAIDVLVNNAGSGDLRLFESAPWDKLERMIRLNVLALTHLTHLLVGPMIRCRRGGILNISSGFGLTFMPGAAAYAATKHYVTAFSESLRLEVSGAGVVVSQACPGPVATEFLSIADEERALQIPSFVEIGAARCARYCLRKFARGRALIVPGGVIRFALLLGRLSPRPLLRLVYRLVAWRLRRSSQTPAIPAGRGR